MQCVCVYMYMYVQMDRYPWRLRESIKSPGGGAIGCCEPSYPQAVLGTKLLSFARTASALNNQAISSVLKHVLFF